MAKRQRYNVKMNRISLSLAEDVISMVDKAAAQDFTTRSDVIRMAILWYLRPQGRDLNQADPDEILKTLQHRKTRADVRKMVRDLPKNGS